MVLQQTARAVAFFHLSMKVDELEKYGAKLEMPR
jgi:hypothetical protein